MNEPEQSKSPQGFDEWLKQKCTDWDGVGDPPPEHIVIAMQAAWNARQPEIDALRVEQQRALQAFYSLFCSFGLIMTDDASLDDKVNAAKTELAKLEAQEKRIAEAKDLLGRLAGSREFLLYIAPDSTYGKRVTAFLAALAGEG